MGDGKLEPCPDLDCDGMLEYKHEADGVRAMCIICGTSGPWSENMDEAARTWNRLSVSVREREAFTGRELNILGFAVWRFAGAARAQADFEDQQGTAERASEFLRDAADADALHVKIAAMKSAALAETSKAGEKENGKH